MVAGGGEDRALRRPGLYGGRGADLQSQALQQVSHDLASPDRWIVEIRGGRRQRPPGTLVFERHDNAWALAGTVSRSRLVAAHELQRQDPLGRNCLEVLEIALIPIVDVDPDLSHARSVVVQAQDFSGSEPTRP